MAEIFEQAFDAGDGAGVASTAEQAVAVIGRDVEGDAAVREAGDGRHAAHGRTEGRAREMLDTDFDADGFLAGFEVGAEGFAGGAFHEHDHTRRGEHGDLRGRGEAERDGVDRIHNPHQLALLADLQSGFHVRGGCSPAGARGSTSIPNMLRRGEEKPLTGTNQH